MKRTLVAMLLLTVMLGCAVFAQAEIIPPYGEGQIGWQSVVLSENLTVRKEPNANAPEVQKLHYGNLFSVMKQENGWAEISVSDDVDASPIGWVNADYIAVDPAWYRTEALTPVYAWNDTGAPKVALLTGDTMLPILKDDGDWLVVSLRGASGWILKTAQD